MSNFLKAWLLPIIHIGVIILVFGSPWLIPWPYVLLIMIAYQIQLIIFKGCVLSQWQFNNRDEGFYYHYLSQIFPKIKKRIIDIVLDYIVPVVIVGLAYVIQTR
jgi:hypothetical protein